MPRKLKSDETNLAAGVERGSLRWLKKVGHIKLNLNNVTPAWDSIEDRRSGPTISDALSNLGYAFKDGVSSITSDTLSVFRKEDPDALVARKLREATPSVRLSKKR